MRLSQFCVAEVELINQTEVEKKAEEERRKTVIVGDMQPLVNSLPTLAARQVGLVKFFHWPITHDYSIDLTLGGYRKYYFLYQLANAMKQ